MVSQLSFLLLLLLLPPLFLSLFFPLLLLLPFNFLLSLYSYVRGLTYTSSPCQSSKPSRCSRPEGVGGVRVEEVVGRAEGTSRSPTSPRSSTSTMCQRRLTTSTQSGLTCTSAMILGVSFFWVFVVFVYLIIFPFSFLFSFFMFCYCLHGRFLVLFFCVFFSYSYSFFLFCLLPFSILVFFFFWLFSPFLP